MSVVRPQRYRHLHRRQEYLYLWVCTIYSQFGRQYRSRYILKMPILGLQYYVFELIWIISGELVLSCHYIILWPTLWLITCQQIICDLTHIFVLQNTHTLCLSLFAERVFVPVLKHAPVAASFLTSHYVSYRQSHERESLSVSCRDLCRSDSDFHSRALSHAHYPHRQIKVKRKRYRPCVALPSLTAMRID